MTLTSLVVVQHFEAALPAGSPLPRRRQLVQAKPRRRRLDGQLAQLQAAAMIRVFAR